MLCAVLEKNGCEFSVTREPDLNNEITAIAISPSVEARRLTSNLPLAFKEKKLAAVA